MQEKRFYKRLNTDIEGIVFINKNEYACKIRDISEDGIHISIDKEDFERNKEKIDKEAIIKIQFVDLYMYLNKERYETVTCSVYIRYSYWEDDRILHMGGRVTSYEYRNYVARKKVAQVYG